MLEIKRVTEDSGFYGIISEDGELAFSASDGGKLLGFCTYKIVDGCVLLRRLETSPPDPSLADGIARAALACSEAVAHCVSMAGDGAELERFCRLSGIKGSEKTKISKVFSTCGG